MSLDFDAIPQLRKTQVQPGERWILIADFNIDQTNGVIRNTGRIDCELADARQILSAGGVVAFLAHKGRFKDGDASSLEFVTPYLARQLGCAVSYFHENDTPAAVEFVRQLAPGTAAVMGNTRQHAGEETNDAELAERFAALGDRCAIGGFGKAHREHASNVGIQQHIACRLAQSQIEEMRQLAPWSGVDRGRFSVAVLGGVKKEKITVGLTGFAQTYDAVIPGGIVLNTILAVHGHRVGGSLLRDGDKSFEKAVEGVLNSAPTGCIHVPKQVVIARRKDGAFHDPHTIDISAGVPDDYMIVDSILSADTLAALDKMADTQGRLILAGTPGIYSAGFGEATEAVVERMQRNPKNCIVLGGDTAAEVQHAGPTSTGGGSALYFVSHGTTPVIDALIQTSRDRTQT